MAVDLSLKKNGIEIFLGRWYNTIKDFDFQTLEDVENELDAVEIEIQRKQETIIRLAIKQYKSKKDEERRIEDLEESLFGFNDLYLRLHNLILVKNLLEDGWKIEIT